jgi:hypothetical protein
MRRFREKAVNDDDEVPIAAGLTTAAGLVKTAQNVQRPISLAAVSLVVLLLLFHEILGKITSIDQTVVPIIINWLGIITVITVVLAITSYTIPFLLKGRPGLPSVVGQPPPVSPRQYSVNAPSAGFGASSSTATTSSATSEESADAAIRKGAGIVAKVKANAPNQATKRQTRTLREALTRREETPSTPAGSLPSPDAKPRAD